MVSSSSLVLICFLNVISQTLSLSIVVGSSPHHRHFSGNEFRDSAPMVVIPLTSFVNPFNVGQDIQVEAKVKSLGNIFRGIRSSLEHVAGNVIQNLGNLRSQLILESSKNRRPSTDRIGHLLDEQIQQTRRTVHELRNIFLAGVRNGARDDMTPRKAVQFVSETIVKSLNEFWNSSAATQHVNRAEERIDEDVIDSDDSSLSNEKREGKPIRENIKATQLDRNRHIPEELRIRLENLRRKIQTRNGAKKVKHRNTDFDLLSPTNANYEVSQTTEGTSKSYLKEKSIKLGNNTISELLSTLGHDCLAIMLCKAGAHPNSMGSFGPWAIDNFEDMKIKQSTKKNHPVLVQAYNDGKRFLERNKQRCTERFDKCELFHTYESS